MTRFQSAAYAVLSILGSEMDKAYSSLLPHRALQIDPGSFSGTLAVSSSTTISKSISTSEIPQNLEFCLLSDATGSFIDDQVNLKLAAPGIAAEILAESPDALFGYAAFKDAPEGGFADTFVYRLLQPLTDDVGAWLASINGLAPNGGGDWPEAQWDGIACATDISYCPTESWGEGYDVVDCGFTEDTPSKKVLVVTTDATFSNDAEILNDLDSTTEALVDAGVVLIGLKASGAGSELDALAVNTGGSVQALSSDGSNIATAILDGLGTLSTTVTYDSSSCPPGLEVNLDPQELIVQSGDDAEFLETITVIDPALAGTTVVCGVDFFDNGAPVGTQTITVEVPLTLAASTDDPGGEACSPPVFEVELLSGDEPVPDAPVTFEVTEGPHAGDYLPDLDSSAEGKVSFTHSPTGPFDAGTDTIEMCSRGVCVTMFHTWDKNSDADTFTDACDNCPDIANQEQADTDGDGFGDACDICADSDLSLFPDVLQHGPMTGCSMADLMEGECECPGDWRNHGQYVKCVAHALNDLHKADAIDEVQRDDLQEKAAETGCGKTLFRFLRN